MQQKKEIGKHVKSGHHTTGNVRISSRMACTAGRICTGTEQNVVFPAYRKCIPSCVGWHVLWICTGTEQDMWHFGIQEMHPGQCRMTCTVDRICTGTVQDMWCFLHTGNVSSWMACTVDRIYTGTEQDMWCFLHTENVSSWMACTVDRIYTEQNRTCDVSCMYTGNVSS